MLSYFGDSWIFDVDNRSDSLSFIGILTGILNGRALQSCEVSGLINWKGLFFNLLKQLVESSPLRSAHLALVFNYLSSDSFLHSFVPVGYGSINRGRGKWHFFQACLQN